MAGIITGGALLSCTQQSEKDKNGKSEIIGKTVPKIENGLMTPEVLYSFGRIGDVQVSPDRSKILYQVTYVSIQQNKTNPELFVMDPIKNKLHTQILVKAIPAGSMAEKK